MSGTRR